MFSKKEWLYVGYVCLFMSVYILSILASVVPTVFHSETPAYYNSYISTANATTVGAVGMSGLGLVVIVVLSLFTLTSLVGAFAFKKAI